MTRVKGLCYQVVGHAFVEAYSKVGTVLLKFEDPACVCLEPWLGVTSTPSQISQGSKVTNCIAASDLV